MENPKGKSEKKTVENQVSGNEKPAKSACGNAVEYLKETVHDAFYKPVMTDDSYVSHKINGNQRKPEQKMRLKSDEHVFNIGKIPESVQSVRERIKAVFERNGERPIYSPEFIEASLSYLFKNLKDGEKLQVVVYRVLSELFNGPKDVENFLTTKEEIELIYRIAAEKFGKYGSSIEVVDLERQPQNRDLFAVLRESVDEETGIVDPEKAYGTTEAPVLNERPSSLEIARCLYAATKKDITFKNAVLKGLTAKLKGEGEECNENSGYYAMTEIAIRLSEIIADNKSHAGVSRQHIYDDMVLKLIEGKNGTYRNIEPLWPLFDILEGLDFETIHINNIDNPVTHKKRRGNAMKRLATGAASVAAVGLAVAGAQYGVSYYLEKKQKEVAELAIQEQVREQVKYDRYRLDYKWPLPPEHNASNVSYLAKEMLEQAHMRYKISPALDDDLKPLLLEFLLEQKDQMSEFLTNKYTTTNFVDLFLQKHKLFLTAKGVEMERPYQNLMPHWELMKKTLKENDAFSMREDDVSFDCPRQVSGCFVSINRIGIFRPTMSWSTFELAILKSRKQEYLVARSLYNDEWSDFQMPKQPYTSKQARQVVSEFIKTQRTYDIVHLLPDTVRIYRLIGAEFVDEEYEYQVPAITGNEGGREEIVYKDFMGEFEYRLIKTGARGKDDGIYGRYIDVFLARKPEESHYTLARAIEAAQLFKKARDNELNWQPPPLTMNIRNHIIDLLTKTGLTRSEAEVYVAVSKKPGSELSAIRKETGYSGATVYRAFDKLKEMGFITSSPGNWRKKIEAVSLRVIGEKIAREQRKLRKVELELKRLDSIFHISSGIEMAEPVEVITDQNLIIQKNFEILNRPWEQFQAYGEGEVLADVLGKDFDREFIDIRRRKGKSCLLVLTELGPYGNELMKNSRMDMRETRYSTEPALHNSINYIYGDEVTIWNRDPEMGNRALVIKDPSLVKMHKSMFDMLHKKSKSG